MRAMPMARPETRASANASSETVMVSRAPSSRVGRKATMSSSEKITEAGPSVVVAGQSPLRQDLLHLVVVLHPLHRRRERGDPLDVTLAEGIAAVAGWVLEGARL